jgi:hypothetical protein
MYKDIMKNKTYERSAEVNCSTCNGCPCSYTEESEYAQNMGCLPDHNTLVERYLKGEGIWACHSDATKPCGGLIQILKNNNIKMDKNNNILVDEDNAFVPEMTKLTSEERDSLVKKGPWTSGIELKAEVLRLIQERKTISK